MWLIILRYLKISLYSKLDQIAMDTDILLIDSYGEAAKFYNISKSIFVGKSTIKSLVNDSGQNPLEPSMAGCKIFHGPYVSNLAKPFSNVGPKFLSRVYNPHFKELLGANF